LISFQHWTKFAKRSKELLLDKMEMSTEEEMSAYIEQLYGLLPQAIQDAVDHGNAHLRAMREMAAKKFGRQAPETKQ